MKRSVVLFVVAAGVLSALAHGPETKAAIMSSCEAMARSIAARETALKDACSLADYRPTVLADGTKVWSAALQKALDEHEIVRIPAGEWILEKTVYLPSNRRIVAATNALVKAAPAFDVRGYLMRNRPGADNVGVIGGIWEDCVRTNCHRTVYGDSSTVFRFKNCSNVTFRDLTVRKAAAFSLQFGAVTNLWVENIVARQSGADGVHVNGNVANALIRHIRGNTGDDLVALNAWDWWWDDRKIGSTESFGPMRNVFVDDVLSDEGGYKVVRLLPGWREEKGVRTDCPLERIVLRNIQNLYRFSMVMQGGGTARNGMGRMDDIYVDNVSFKMKEPWLGRLEREPDAFFRGHAAPFFIGSDIGYLSIENVTADLRCGGWHPMHLVTVGPWGWEGRISPTVEEIHLKNIRFVGTPPDEIVHAVVFADNPFVSKWDTGVGRVLRVTGDIPDTLADGFADPPLTARPQTWWHWMNGNVTLEGITKDLEAMKAIGLSGAQIFDAGCEIPPGPVAFNTPAWKKAIDHAIREAHRLGLSLTLANCSGWSSSGGPWTTPSNAMKRVVFSSVEVKGGATFDGELPALPKGSGFSADIAVVALPKSATTNGSEIAFIGTKSSLYRWPNAADLCARTQPTFPGPFAAKADVAVLARGASCGRLRWTAPAGRDWTVLRVGYVSTDQKNDPASRFGGGLEVDKLDRRALEVHFDAYVGKMLAGHHWRMTGDHDEGLTGVLVDSYEPGSQNWTHGFEKEFAKRAGYEIDPFLPCLAGRVVGTPEASEKFLADFRRVVSEMFVENYPKAFAELCHRHGLALSLEPYGNAPVDDFAYGRYSDIPMGEFWSSGGADSGDANGEGNAPLIASMAHFWGKRIAAMEAYTAPPGNAKWKKNPHFLKAQGDRVLAGGANRLVYHRFTHQPDDRYLPGLTMGMWGVHFDRTQTWWNFGRDFITYQGRCQWMLQQGEYVADAFLYTGGLAPDHGAFNSAKQIDKYGRLPFGYQWDWGSRAALLALRVTKDGRLLSPGGMVYPALVLPDLKLTDTNDLAKIAALKRAGVKVVDRAGFARLGVEPDFICRTKLPEETFLRFNHRRQADGTDIYFVCLANAEAVALDCSFRASGRVPELWDAVTGRRVRARTWKANGSRTDVTLRMEPRGSIFVVFRPNDPKLPVEPAYETVRTIAVPKPDVVRFPVLPIAGAKPTGRTVEWRPDGWTDWTKASEPDIRYFSGTAAYAWTSEVPALAKGERLFLDLGEVNVLAEVTVNGKTLPVAWKPPYRIDLTDALAQPVQANRLSFSVRVTNLWPNRLIGDDIECADDCEWQKEGGIVKLPDWVKKGETSPTKRHTFTTWKHWKKTDKLLPSGITGPVNFEIRKEQK